MAESRGSKQGNAVRPAAAIAKRPGSRSGQLQTETQSESAGSATFVDRQVAQPQRNGAHWLLQQKLSTRPSKDKIVAAAMSINRPHRAGSGPPVTLSRDRVSESSSESSLDG